MEGLWLVLAVVCFWGFVACVIALLVRYTATSRDDEEVVCGLDEAYYTPDANTAETTPVAHAS